MAFNPLREKGIPIDKQFKNWVDLNSKPYDKETVHPYTRTRGILMNGIEVEAMIFKRQFARNTSDMDLRRHLALTRSSLLYTSPSPRDRTRSRMPSSA